MSFDAIAIWPLSGADAVALALTETDIASTSTGLADLRSQWTRLRTALPGLADDWAVDAADEDSLECSHHRSEVQLLFTSHRIFVSIPYYRSEAAFGQFIATLEALAVAGATMVDNQSGTVCDPRFEAERLRRAYHRAPRPSLPRSAPSRLGRRGYTLGLLALLVATGGLLAVVVRLELDRIHPGFALAPFAAALICKMFVLDLRRLRDLRRDERLVLWNVFVPIGQLVLLPLLYQPSRET